MEDRGGEREGQANRDSEKGEKGRDEGETVKKYLSFSVRQEKKNQG